MMNTSADNARQSESAFVSGIAASERPSAKLARNETKRDDNRKPLAHLRDFGDGSQEASRLAPLKDEGNGKLAVADVDSGEFEAMWGADAKPRSQRETFLAKQAFEQGKKEGEEQTRKNAFAEGLKEGRESGYKQGFQDGAKEREGEVAQRAEQQAQQLIDQRIKVIAGFLEQLMKREKEASHKRDTELMALMIAIFDKILPALAHENGEKEVLHFFRAILQRFENIPQITVTLAEGAQEIAEQIRQSVEKILPDDKSIDTLVSFNFDPSFSKADCKIAWAEGEVERRFQNLWEEVKQALQQHLSVATSDKLEMRSTEGVASASAPHSSSSDAQASEESEKEPPSSPPHEDLV